MTKPSGGYPDFQGYASWRATPAAASATSYPPGTQVLGTFNMTNYASLAVVVENTTGVAELHVQWWTDSSMTTFVDDATIPLNHNMVVNLAMPAESAFVSVSVIVQAGPNATITSVLTPTNLAMNECRFIGVPRQLSFIAKTILASATDSLTSAYAYPGQALLSFVPGDALGKLQVRVQSLDRTGNPASTLFFDPGPVGAFQQILILPVAAIVMQIINTDAGAPHVYDCSLTPMAH